MSQELIFQLALSLIKSVGPITAKKLIAYYGGPEAVFKEKIANLKKIPTIGNVLAKEIQNPIVLSRADQEMRYIQEHGISILSYWDSDYPTQLKQFIDTLILLFSKGKLVWDKDLNSNNDITINLATKNYVPGVYFLKFQSFQFNRTEKVILNKV